MTATHPNDRELDDFLLGKFPDADHAVIEDHLASCPGCQDRAADRTAQDPLTDLLAAARTRTDADWAAAPTVAPAGSATPSLQGFTQAWDEGAPAPAGGDEAPPALADHPKYHVRRRLGTGGMGTVWLAEHAVMNRLVAVKVIRPDLLARLGVIGRFLHEVRAAAKLHHPNIVTAFDAEPVGDSCLLVMEYVPGETLGDRLRAGPLPVAEACRAVRDAGRGLAHAAGLIHRDVKPHNLIRDAAGTTKVLDFGLAGVVAGEVVAAGGDGMTGPGTVAGTPDYIAPEQATDPHAADARADVYGLGCTLYHLLAGRPPFPDGSAVEKLDAQRTREPAPIPGLPADLAAVLARMLAKRPADRYQTADEVADALEPFCEPARSRGAIAERGRRPRRWGVVAAGLLAVGLLATAGVVYKVQRDHEVIAVETDNPDIEVVMRRNGELIRIVDTKTKEAWDLDTKKLRLKPDGSDLEIDLPGREPLVLRRNGNAAVTIRREPQPPPGPAPAASADIQPYRVFVGHTKRTRHAIFSADARTVYSCGDDEYVRVWDVESGRETAKFDLKCPVFDLALADEGKLLLAVTCPTHRNQPPSRLSAWDVRRGKEAAAFPAVPARERFNALAISPDGKRAATSAPGVIRIWDVPGRKLERTWTVPKESAAYGIAWSPDRRHIAVAGDWFSVWEATDGKPVYRSSTLTGDTTTAFSPDGKQVFAAGWGGVVRVYTHTTWQIDRKLRTQVPKHGAGTYLSVTPNGRLLIGAHTAEVRLWDVAADRALARLVGKDLDSIGVAASADGKWAAAGSEDGKVRVWRLPEVPAAKH